MSNISLLENYIGHLSAKNKVISQNIANIGTEGYIRQNVKFDDMLQNEMHSKIKATESKHIKVSAQSSQGFQTEIYLDKEKEANGGVNNVDIETEMAELAENAINFKFASKKIAKHFQEMREVIKGGKG
jgi:flagellar basal-body rod protein FlgB